VPGLINLELGSGQAAKDLGQAGALDLDPRRAGARTKNGRAKRGQDPDAALTLHDQPARPGDHGVDAFGQLDLVIARSGQPNVDPVALVHGAEQGLGRGVRDLATQVE
jgi:hypothetical protein